MIVVHVGLKKSGSAWLYHMINEIAVLGGMQDTTRIRDEFGLEAIMKTENNRCNVRNPRNLLRLLKPHFAGRSFVVRAHRGGSPLTVLLARLGIVKVVFSFRDPYDVVVSLLQHAEKARARGGSVAHTHIHTVEDSVEHVLPFLDEWKWWSKRDAALLIRYEDLVGDTERELRRFRDFVGLNVADEELKRIADHYSADAIRARNESWKRFHLNKSGAGRHLESLSEADYDLCERRLGDIRRRMGYGDVAA